MKILLFILLFIFGSYSFAQDVENGNNTIQKEKYLLRLQHGILIGAVGNKGIVTVFADPHCPHCREFYSHVNEIISSGYVLQFSILPITNHSLTDYEKILCSNNPIQALDQAYKKEIIPQNNLNCHINFDSETLVQKAYKMTSTPYFILEDTTARSGFKDVDDFLLWLKTNR